MTDDLEKLNKYIESKIMSVNIEYQVKVNQLYVERDIELHKLHTSYYNDVIRLHKKIDNMNENIRYEFDTYLHEFHDDAMNSIYNSNEFVSEVRNINENLQNSVDEVTNITKELYTNLEVELVVLKKKLDADINTLQAKYKKMFNDLYNEKIKIVEKIQQEEYFDLIKQINENKIMMV